MSSSFETSMPASLATLKDEVMGSIGTLLEDIVEVETKQRTRAALIALTTIIDERIKAGFAEIKEDMKTMMETVMEGFWRKVIPRQFHPINPANNLIQINGGSSASYSTDSNEEADADHSSSSSYDDAAGQFFPPIQNHHARHHSASSHGDAGHTAASPRYAPSFDNGVSGRRLPLAEIAPPTGFASTPIPRRTVNYEKQTVSNQENLHPQFYPRSPHTRQILTSFGGPLPTKRRLFVSQPPRHWVNPRPSPIILLRHSPIVVDSDSSSSKSNKRSYDVANPNAVDQVQHRSHGAKRYRSDSVESELLPGVLFRSKENGHTHPGAIDTGYGTIEHGRAGSVEGESSSGENAEHEVEEADDDYELVHRDRATSASEEEDFVIFNEEGLSAEEEDDDDEDSDREDEDSEEDEDDEESEGDEDEEEFEEDYYDADDYYE